MDELTDDMTEYEEFKEALLETLKSLDERQFFEFLRRAQKSSASADDFVTLLLRYRNGDFAAIPWLAHHYVNDTDGPWRGFLLVEYVEERMSLKETADLFNERIEDGRRVTRRRTGRSRDQLTGDDFATD